jgi:SAM-dependent methyltransferase
MSFSSEWDTVYQAGKQHTAWPWSDLVSLVYRHIPTAFSKCRVLELGCGTGANVPFFLALGADYYAVEGSDSAVAVVHERYPSVRNTVTVGDFTEALPSGPFDLIVDRAALTHNCTRAIRNTLELVRERLVPGGCYIGIDWFSDRHSDRAIGSVVDDGNTFTQFDAGQFQGVGRVHFSDESHLRYLFSRFELILLAEKTIRRLQPPDEHLFASFNIVAKKPRD